MIRGADWLVDGASALARRLSVSELMIGLTIVALGTSLPELIVSILAGYRDANEMILGNIVGSNLMNTLLILGVTALIAPIPFERGTVLREIPFSLLASVVVWILVNDLFFEGVSPGQLGRIDGLMLLAFFLVFLAYLVAIAGKDEIESDGLDLPMGKSLLLLAGGLIALPLGGEFVVRGAVGMAESLGVSQKMIGLTIVAAGTSLPELVTCVAAARKGRAALAVGNIIGSNISNLLLVLGVSAGLQSIPFDPVMNLDLALMVASALALLSFMFIDRQGSRIRLALGGFSLDKAEGLLFIGAYTVYLVYTILRA